MGRDESPLVPRSFRAELHTAVAGHWMREVDTVNKDLADAPRSGFWSSVLDVVAGHWSPRMSDAYIETGSPPTADAEDHGPFFGDGSPDTDDSGQPHDYITLHPTSFNDARAIGEYFRAGTPVAIDLTKPAEREVAHRLIDFAAGLTFGLQGSLKQVAPGIILLSPDVDWPEPDAGGSTAAGQRHRLLTGEDLAFEFQPLVALPDRRLVAVECLARWKPGHGPVEEADPMTVAERTGTLDRLTDTIIREGLQRSRQWSDDGSPLPVVVNVSARMLLDPGFPYRVNDLLAEYAVQPELLTLDIAEARIMHLADHIDAALRRLNQIGVRLAVDDFGTGYASLTYLTELPLHQLKIDRTLVREMADDLARRTIIRSIVDLSHSLGLTVVALGVDGESALHSLQEIGCDIGQGHVFTGPLPHDRLKIWIDVHTHTEQTATGEVHRIETAT